MPGSVAEVALLIAVRRASMSLDTVWSCDAPLFCAQVLTRLSHVVAAAGGAAAWDAALGEGDRVEAPTFSVMPINGVEEEGAGAGAAAGWCVALAPQPARLSAAAASDSDANRSHARSDAQAWEVVYVSDLPETEPLSCAGCHRVRVNQITTQASREGASRCEPACPLVARLDAEAPAMYGLARSVFRSCLGSEGYGNRCLDRFNCQ